MKSLEWCKEHIKELEKDDFFDHRWTKRFLDFLPCSEWEDYGFKAKEGFDQSSYEPKEWNEKNILEQLESDVRFGYWKAVDERGISSELMADVVNSWCIALENGLDLDGEDGYYHIRQFTTVANHYGWKLEDKD